MAKGGKKGDKKSGATSEKSGGKKGRRGNAESFADDGDNDNAETGSGLNADGSLGDNLLGLGSVSGEAAGHAQTTITQGWGWAADANGPASPSAGGAMSPTKGKATDKGTPEIGNNWFKSTEWDSIGPATAKGGAGGGWDIASSIHGGSSSSVSIAGHQTPASAFRRAQQSVEEETTAPGKKRKTKLSTVHEVRTTTMSPSLPPNGSDRLSLASASANAGLTALAAAGQLSPSALVDGSSYMPGSRAQTPPEVRRQFEGQRHFLPDHQTVTLNRTGSVDVVSPRASVDPSIAVSSYARTTGVGLLSPGRPGGTSIRSQTVRAQSVRAPSVKAPSMLNDPTAQPTHVSFAPTPSPVANKDLVPPLPMPRTPDSRMPSPRSSSVSSPRYSNPHVAASFPYPSPPPVTSPKPRSVSSPQALSPSKQSFVTADLPSPPRPPFTSQVSYSGGKPSPSVVGLEKNATGASMQVFVPNNASIQVQMSMPQPENPPINVHPATPKSPGWPGGFPTAEAGPSMLQPEVQMSSSHGHEDSQENEENANDAKGKSRAKTSWEPGVWSTSGEGHGVTDGNTGWRWNSPRTSAGSPEPPPPLQPPPAPQPLPTTRPSVPTAALRQTGPVSSTLQRALSPTAYPQRPEPTHDVRIQETGGLALKPAQRPMFGRHRHVTDRFYWNLDPAHDSRVESLLEWCGTMQWGLANLGLSKFLQWRKRGALFANADFRPWKSPDEPAFDWMSFDDIQKTLDRTLQESIATYDPATTALVFVFLVSKSGSSVAIWRKKVAIPTSLQLKHATETTSVRRQIAQQKLIIKVERDKPPRPVVEEPPPLPPPKTKKRKWWQFWKSDKEIAVPAGKENVQPTAGRGKKKLAKRR